MRAIAGSFLLALLVSGCGNTEKVQLDTGRIIPSDSGKCQQMIGSRSIDVECPKK